MKERREKRHHPQFVIFVEGGGHKRLDDDCRRAFKRFFEKTDLGERAPRIAVCGSRSSAYDDFCTALSQARPEDMFLLLVDSEAAFVATKGSDNTLTGFWAHVKARVGDGWDCPSGASEEMLHFMVECMENWFLADIDALKKHFCKNFNEAALTVTMNVESVSKANVYRQLSKATAECAGYSKGKDSFLILEKMDPLRVAAKSVCAKRLIEQVRRLSGNKTEFRV